MPWVRLEDNYFTHRKVVGLSKDAKLLDLASIAFSARELRDGMITRADIRIISAQVEVGNPFRVADQLVASGRWSKADGGYAIHDYLKYNPSREQVVKDRESTARRVSDWRKEHRSNAPSNGVTSGVGNGVSTAAPLTSTLTKHSPRESVSARAPVIDEAFKATLEDEFSDQLGSRAAVRDRIDAALAHVSRTKYTDDRVYLRHWLRGDAERAQSRAIGRNGQPEPIRRITDRTGTQN